MVGAVVQIREQAEVTPLQHLALCRGNPLVVLACGKSGAGKDLVSDHLVHRYGFTKLAFADPLKEVVAQLYEFPARWCYTRVGKAYKPPLGDGLTVGELLQRFGSNVARHVTPDLWVSKALERMRQMGRDRYVVADCRFFNEVTRCIGQAMDLRLLYLTRESPRHLGARDANHASEDLSWVERVPEILPGVLHTLDNRHLTKDDTRNRVSSWIDPILVNRVQL